MSESVVFVRNTIDLRFELTETSMGIIGHITYNLSRFSVTDIREIASAFERVLTLVEKYPEVPMARLCERLLTRADAVPGSQQAPPPSSLAGDY